MSEIVYNKKTSLGEVICSRDRSFYENLISLKKYGAEIISIKDLAELELKKQIPDQEGKLAGIVREGILFDKQNKKFIFLKENPLFEEENSREASDLFEKNREDLNFDKKIAYFLNLANTEKSKTFEVKIPHEEYLKLSQNPALSTFLFGDLDKYYAKDKLIFVCDEYHLESEKNSFVLPIAYLGKRGERNLSGVCSIKAQIIGIIKSKKKDLINSKEKVNYESDLDYDSQINNAGSLK